ncbi:MAG TPA: hypothetical protein VNL18_12210 [Gemmatimonadales bacterium]|nr:hypothetical protein [Gemmatimonadales bacterium]
MIKTCVAGLGALALAVAAARPAQAQLAANPVYVSPKAPTGLTVAADFGTTLSTKVTVAGTPVSATNKPNHVGLRATLGLPIIAIGVGAGQYNSDVTGADKEIQFAGNVGLKVFSPPLVPVGIGLNAGVGYLKMGSGATATKFVSIPLGLGVAVKPPSPSVSFEVWGSPRVQLNAVSAPTGKRTQAGIGASGGVNVGMPMGLGFHIAADWTKMSAKASAGTGSLTLPETKTFVLGLGLHYTFTIPGLPMVPVI